MPEGNSIWVRYTYLFLLTRLALDKLLEKGIAISAAAVRRNGKYEHIYRVTDWDNRCKSCLTKESEGGHETIEGA